MVLVGLMKVRKFDFIDHKKLWAVVRKLDTARITRIFFCLMLLRFLLQALTLG